MMESQERRLYHQIHPLKLCTDWGTGLISLVPFWSHNLAIALAVGIIPSVLVSLLLIRFADLEGLKQSRFGGYLARYMTRGAESARLAGFVVMAVGAWVHQPWLLAGGLLVILLAWGRGLFMRPRHV